MSKRRRVHNKNIKEFRMKLFATHKSLQLCLPFPLALFLSIFLLLLFYFIKKREHDEWQLRKTNAFNTFYVFSLYQSCIGCFTHIIIALCSNWDPAILCLYFTIYYHHIFCCCSLVHFDSRNVSFVWILGDSSAVRCAHANTHRQFQSESGVCVMRHIDVDRTHVCGQCGSKTLSASASLRARKTHRSKLEKQLFLPNRILIAHFLKFYPISSPLDDFVITKINIYSISLLYHSDTVWCGRGVRARNETVNRDTEIATFELDGPQVRWDRMYFIVP